VSGEDLPTPPYQAPKKGSCRQGKAATQLQRKTGEFQFHQASNITAAVSTAHSLTQETVCSCVIIIVEEESSFLGICRRFI
jgi:hypothetical protein